MNKKFLLLSIIFIISANIVLYAKTANYEFVNFDDPQYVYENSLIKDIDGTKIKRISTEYYFANYQPLVLYSYAIEYKLFGLNARGYHLTNVIFHILNSILVFWLIYIICADPWAALITALLFSLHPVQVESVAWISERKGLMCAFFYLIAFICYIRHAKEDKRALYFAAIILFVMALLSKPMAVTFPVILLLYTYFEGKLDKPNIIKMIPLFLLSAVSSIVTIFAQRSGGAVYESQLGSLFTNVFSALYALGFYIIKLIYPTDLSVHYGYVEGFRVASIEFVIGVVVLAAIVLFVIKLKKIAPLVSFGILFFLISLIPVLRFVPIGDTMAADRYLYIPSIGFFFAVVFLLREHTITKPAAKSIVTAAAVLYIFFIFVTTFEQADVFKNSYNLWTNVLKTDKDHFNAYIGVGDYWMGKKEYKKAREQFLKVLDLESGEGRVLALYDVGLSYVSEGDILQAERYFVKVVEEFPDNRLGRALFAYLYLGDIYIFKNRPDLALGYLKRALTLGPEDARVHNGLGKAYERSGNITEAVKHYQLADKFGGGWALPKQALKRLGASP